MGVMKLGRRPRADRVENREGKCGPNVAVGLPDVRGTRGHPTVLTEALIAEFARLIPIVAYIETAGDLLGISGWTWKNWVVDGRGEAKNIDTVPGYTPDPKRALTLSFFKMYKNALATYQERNLTKIHAAGDRDWRAAAWLQERRYYAQWGDKAKEIAELKKQLEILEKEVARSTGPTSPIITPTESDDDGREHDGTDPDSGTPA